MYHWNLNLGAPYATLRPSFGLSFVDPTPIATHTISPDALESKSKYSKTLFFFSKLLSKKLIVVVFATWFLLIIPPEIL